MRIDCQKAIGLIKQYLSNDIAYPFFVAANSSLDLWSIISSLPDNLCTISASDFCSEDGLPDEDAIYSVMENTSSPLLIKGVGDYIALSEKTDFLGRIAGQTFPKKIIVLCRNIGTLLEKLYLQNTKFGLNRWCELVSNTDLLVVRVMPDVPIQKIEGFKALLKYMEGYPSGKAYVSTEVDISCAKVIMSAYDALREEDTAFIIPENALTKEQWTDYLVRKNLDTNDPFHWKSYLRLLLDGATTPYFKLVLQHSPNYDCYCKELLNALLRVPCSSDTFRQLYQERKMFLRLYPDIDMSEYIRDTLEKDSDRIFYLTNNTVMERHAIVEEIARHRIDPKQLEEIYPDITLYLNKYTFSGDGKEFFTEYFERYKTQKISNKLQQDFLDKVIEISKPGNRKYNSLPTRELLIMQMKGQNCGLFWIDALGVEYLGYIKSLAKEMRLWIDVRNGRSFLPTLTGMNRSFYENWEGYKFPKESRLDTIKHEGAGAASSTDPAIHLAEELAIIRESLEKIKNCLVNHTANVESVLLVSDHGASRLCVLNHHENKWKITRWDMEESGKHSGRCCMISDADECPESATQDKGYWVLANYDRFKGGRLSGNCVEVHGGASLEEVVVPVIKFTLANESIVCKVYSVEDDVATIIKPLDGPIIMQLYCSKTTANISVVIRDKTYTGKQNALNPALFDINLNTHNEIWRSSTIYEGTVFDGDNEITVIRFRVQRTRRATRNEGDGADFFGS